MKTYTLLKVLVGSQAHGLATPESDADFRSVYALPTQNILSLNFKYKGSTWLEGDIEDNTAWEIGHFLSLAMQCNPTILEVFLAPKVEASAIYGNELRSLFPVLWTPQKAYDAFTGYGKNQQKKFLDKKDKRPNKYAAAHIRTLVNLNQLLSEGTFSVNLEKLPIFEMLKRIKAGFYEVGEVVDLTEELTDMATIELERCKHTPLSEEERYTHANAFLLKVRDGYW